MSGASNQSQALPRRSTLNSSGTDNASSVTVTKALALLAGGYVLYSVWNRWLRTQCNQNMLEITEVNIYPIKGCKGLSITKPWELTANGLKHDREWMIVDCQTQMFVSQRKRPQLALLRVQLMYSNSNSMRDVIGLRLTVPSMQDFIEVPITEEYGLIGDIDLWGSKVCGYDQGPHVQYWLTQLLNNKHDRSRAQTQTQAQNAREYRLVHITERINKRKLELKYTPAHLTSTATTAYADGYPLLFVSESSLTHLNAHLARNGSAKVPMNRFRPSIVFRSNAHANASAHKPFVEDTIERITVDCRQRHRDRRRGDSSDDNSNAPVSVVSSYSSSEQKSQSTMHTSADLITFHLCKPCARCKVPLVDQSTGRRASDIEPIGTLAQIHSGKHMIRQLDVGNAKHAKDVYFGMNAIHETCGAQTIQVGQKMFATFRK